MKFVFKLLDSLQWYIYVVEQFVFNGRIKEHEL